MWILTIFIIIPSFVLIYASWFNKDKHDSTLDDEWDEMFLTPYKTNNNGNI